MADIGNTRPVAWITGGSRGMGADTAVHLARAGYDVALTARDRTRLDGVAEEVRMAGGRAFAQASDLTDRQSVAAFAEAALAAFGRCDAVCNIGIYKGAGSFQLIVDTSLDEMAKTFEADVIAGTLLVQRALPSMLANGGGTIVNVSSSSVFLNPPGNVHNNGWSFAYVAAKAGIDRFASILNVELGEQGIRAFNVEPGFVAYGSAFREKLEKYPGSPVSPPESIGPAITWLIRDPNASRLLSKRVSLPDLTHKQRLLPGWEGPGTMYDSQRPE